MAFEHTKVASVVWVLVMCAVGLAFGVTSAAGWTILVGLALLPAILARVWSGPAARMPERIREARR